jgi:hypothetical protein
MTEIICPNCGDTNFTILAGGCGRRSKMAYRCNNEDCKCRWNS